MERLTRGYKKNRKEITKVNRNEQYLFHRMGMIYARLNYQLGVTEK